MPQRMHVNIMIDFSSFSPVLSNSLDQNRNELSAKIARRGGSFEASWVYPRNSFFQQSHLILQRAVNKIGTKAACVLKLLHIALPEMLLRNGYTSKFHAADYSHLNGHLSRRRPCVVRQMRRKKRSLPYTSL